MWRRGPSPCDKAVAIGVANYMVEAEQLDRELMRLAAQIAKSDPMHLRQMKAMANGAQSAAGFEGFARAGLSQWATWRWHWSTALGNTTADHGDGGSANAKRLAPVKDAESGDAARLSEEAALRARL